MLLLLGTFEESEMQKGEMVYPGAQLRFTSETQSRSGPVGFLLYLPISEDAFLPPPWTIIMP